MEEHATIHWMNDFLPLRLTNRSLSSLFAFLFVHQVRRQDDWTLRFVDESLRHRRSLGAWPGRASRSRVSSEV